MVAVFVALKWHLLRSRLRASSGGKKSWLIVAAVVILAVVGLICWGIASSRPFPEAATAIAVLFMSVQLISWTVAPMIAFGVDETVDPSRFALLPLTASTMIRGLLVSSFVGWLPAANALLLIAVAWSVSTPAAVLPIALVCAVLQLVLCIVISRAAATSLASLMNSRRGRDLGMLVGFGIFVLYLVGTGLLNSGDPEDGGFYGSFIAITDILGWTPPGAFARVPALVGNGDLGQAAVALVIGLAGLGLGLLWWSRALARSMEAGPSMTAGSAPGRASSFGGDRAGIARVVAFRDAVLIWRDPMRRLTWLLAAAMVFGYPFIILRDGGGLFLVAFGAGLVGVQAANQLAVEGSGLWLHLVIIGQKAQARAEIIGHAVVVILPGTVLVVAGTVGIGAIQGDLHLVPAALGVNMAVLLGSTAVSCWLSARLPYGMPQSRTSMFATAVQDQKARSAGAAAAGLGGGVVAGVPSGALAIFAADQGDAWGWVGLVVGLAIGGVLLKIMIEKGAALYLETGPEIFAQVAAGDRA